MTEKLKTPEQELKYALFDHYVDLAYEGVMTRQEAISAFIADLALESIVMQPKSC